jgi:predicted dinucleotide-binding enzyme
MYPAYPAPSDHALALEKELRAFLDDPEVDKVDTDVLVLGDDRAATDLVRALADAIPGVRGIYGGRARNAHQVEAFTANLISVNRRYKAHSGLRITDV